MSLLPNYDTRRLGLVPGAFYLGFISISIQVVYARLAVSFAGGNEVYLSLYFFLWLLFSGIGSLLIKTIRPVFLFFALGLFSFVSASLFYLAPQFTNSLPGQLIQPSQYFLTITIALLPVCLLNGGLFSSIANRLEGKGRSGKTYWGEALGALAGGLAITIYYSFEGRDFSYLLFIAIICFTRVLRDYKLLKALLLIAGVIILVARLGDSIEDKLLKYRYRPFELKKSLSGRLVRYDTIQTGELLSLYSGGMKVADFPDMITGQEIFYWPYLAKPDIRNIAFVGAETHMVDNYIPSRLSGLFIFPDDTWQAALKAEHMPAIEICRITDPIAFFDINRRRFDAIAINLGPLLSLYEHRLETARFFSLCRESLTENGILSITVPAYEGIWRDDLRCRLSDIYVNLLAIFGKVGFIPGQNLIFIAGNDVDLEPTRMIENLAELAIDSPYMTPELINVRLNSFKIEQTENQLSGINEISGDLTIGHGLSYYFSKMGLTFSFEKYINKSSIAVTLFCIVLMAFVFSGFTGKKFIGLVNIIYFGLASFLFEILIFYYIQLQGGYLYIALGVIIGLFMLGMAAGAFSGTYYTDRNKMPKTINRGLILTFLLYILLSGLFLLTHDSKLVLLIINVLAGFAGGFGFTLCANKFDSKPGLPYGFDLGGAMVGTAIGLGILLATISIHEVLVALIAISFVLLATNRGICKY
ncbi:MAG: hypothetical protein GY839_17535 [candidate division Zixibacteria bacterium]|nr:hypothetical protein [candidate division Zixibacteria bacterium]